MTDAKKNCVKFIIHNLYWCNKDLGFLRGIQCRLDNTDVSEERTNSVFRDYQSPLTASLILLEPKAQDTLILFARKVLQPVFHQTVYHGVFTVLCTVLSSLIVLFIAILYW